MPEFLTELLVTDTRTYEVIARTPKTITVRTTRPTGEKWSENRDGNPYPCVWHVVGPDENGHTYTLRLRKDGTYRMGQGANPLRPAKTYDTSGGLPAEFTDYRF